MGVRSIKNALHWENSQLHLRDLVNFSLPPFDVSTNRSERLAL